ELRYPERVGYVAGCQTELDLSIGWQYQDWNLVGGAQGLNLIEVQVRKVTHRLSVNWVGILHVFWIGCRCLILSLPLVIATVILVTSWRNRRSQVGVAELPVPLESGDVYGYFWVHNKGNNLLPSLNVEEEQNHNDNDWNKR